MGQAAKQCTRRWCASDSRARVVDGRRLECVLSSGHYGLGPVTRGGRPLGAAALSIWRRRPICEWRASELGANNPGGGVCVRWLGREVSVAWAGDDFAENAGDPSRRRGCGESSAGLWRRDEALARRGARRARSHVRRDTGPGWSDVRCVVAGNQVVKVGRQAADK